MKVDALGAFSRIARVTARARIGVRLLLGAVRREPAAIVQHVDTYLRARSMLAPASLLPHGGDRSSGLRLRHVGVFTTVNAGDTLLPIVLRDLFDQELGRSRWTQEYAHDVVNGHIMRSINESDGLVVGGGGLFLSDSNPNGISGWQWPVSRDQIRQVRKPIVVFAVGYNRFRGQGDFNTVFVDNVIEMVAKSSFFGLRNQGSIRALKTYIPSELHGRLRYQPCMTTHLRQMYPALSETRPGTPPYIALNCAFDRPNLRFGEKSDETLVRLVRATKELARTMPIRYVAHTRSDVYFSQLLADEGVPHDLIQLAGRSPREIIETYKNAAIAVGMRGHAQMIPFGLGTPILTLASHDKMRWFLDDIRHPEWGVEVLDADSDEQIVDRVSGLLDDIADARRQVHEASDELFRVSQSNLKEIGATLLAPDIAG